MRNKITTKELIEKRFSKEKALEIINDAKKEIEQIKWGGKRQNSGRKTRNGEVLDITKRLTKKEADFINYARVHNLNYDELMEG